MTDAALFGLIKLAVRGSEFHGYAMEAVPNGFKLIGLHVTRERQQFRARPCHCL